MSDDDDDFVLKRANDVPEDSLHQLGKIADKAGEGTREEPMAEHEGDEAVVQQKGNAELQPTVADTNEGEIEVQSVESNDKYAPQIGSVLCV